jgi:hypothetical protein
MDLIDLCGSPARRICDHCLGRMVRKCPGLSSTSGGRARTAYCA